jgi:hypothetical protein
VNVNRTCLQSIGTSQQIGLCFGILPLTGPRDLAPRLLGDKDSQPWVSKARGYPTTQAQADLTLHIIRDFRVNIASQLASNSVNDRSSSQQPDGTNVGIFRLLS